MCWCWWGFVWWWREWRWMLRLGWFVLFVGWVVFWKWVCCLEWWREVRCGLVDVWICVWCVFFWVVWVDVFFEVFFYIRLMDLVILFFNWGKIVFRRKVWVLRRVVWVMVWVFVLWLFVWVLDWRWLVWLRWVVCWGGWRLIGWSFWVVWLVRVLWLDLYLFWGLGIYCKSFGCRLFFVLCWFLFGSGGWNVFRWMDEFRVYFLEWRWICGLGWWCWWRLYL